MRIIEDVKLDFKDVLIVPKRSTLSSRAEVNLERTYKFKHSEQTWAGVPIIAANMDQVGCMSMASVLAKHKMLTCLSKFANVPEHFGKYSFEGREVSPEELAIEERTIRTIGLISEDISDESLLDEYWDPTFLCLDVANGYTDSFLKSVTRIRKVFQATTIIAGNVCTPEMTEALILAGADIVKVGIGPGGLCLTRRVAGVGYPQLSAIIECADAAHGLGGHIIADGGCTEIGDIAKAFGAGADFVMLGSMLMGYDECAGNWSYDPDTGIKSLEVYGMSSDRAMANHGGKQAHRASEGRCLTIPGKGPLDPFLFELQGGLRSACTYVGADKLKDLSKRTTFVRVNRQLNDAFRQD
jgi:GMP reductase